MLKTELMEIIAHGENSGIEFKRDDLRPEQLAKEVVALANLQGGRIFISIGQGLSKPYALRHKQREDVYIRIGSRSELASREQQLRLFESGGLLHIEVLPVIGTSIHHIDRQRLNFYLSEIIKDPDVPSTDKEWEQRLLGLGLMASDV